MKIRQCVQVFVLDTNMTKGNERTSSTAMENLRRWDREGHIKIVYTDHIVKELRAGKKVKGLDDDKKQQLDADERAHGSVSARLLSPAEEKQQRARLTEIVFPKGFHRWSDCRDILTLRVAQMHQPCIVITADGASKTQPAGILGAADRLAKEGIIVMGATEAEKLALKLMKDRNRMEGLFAKQEGREIPWWCCQEP